MRQSVARVDSAVPEDSSFVILTRTSGHFCRGRSVVMPELDGTSI